MAKALRGKPPEVKDTRLKLMMYSLAGIGKTTAAIEMPAPYIIDTESGTLHYREAIEKAGGAVFQTTDIEEIIEEVRTLMSTQHPYKTLVIDSFTPPYEAKMDEGAQSREIGDSYGKHIAYADRYAKRLFRLLTLLDMNVVVTSHAKDDWDKGEKRGIKFDGWKKLDYLFDLVLELERRAGTKRFAIVRKTRLPEFEDQSAFEWTLGALAERWGADRLDRKAATVEMASKDQVENLARKMKVLNVPDETQAKWLKAAEVESFEDMTADQVAKCIAYCDKKIKEANGGK